MHCFPPPRIFIPSSRLGVPFAGRVALVLLATLTNTVLHAQTEVRLVQVAPPAATSRVPAITAQGHFVAPQAISAVDISADGKFITAGTMAFSHDANFWQFDARGTVIAKRNLPPWAPMQVATLAGGKAVAAGMAYSRVTPPDPTIWLGPAETLLGPSLKDDLAEAEPRDGEFARWRPGAGDWRTGWLASQMGELFVHGPDWVFHPPGSFMADDGHRVHLRYEDKNQLPTNRATRMAASADGKRIAFGWIALNEKREGLPAPRPVLSVWEVGPNRSLWSAQAAPITETPPPLPNPAADFPEMAKDFRLAADAVVPATVAASVAINGNGSRVAVLEYAAWVWVRSGPAIGKWDPPIHALNFVPRQHGRLRIFAGTGQELRTVAMPEEGMFEAGFGGEEEVVTCWPASWFARGMAGAVWLPVDAPARKLYRIPAKQGPALAVEFPDAIAACAPNPQDGTALVSCWDGKLYLIAADGHSAAPLDPGSPARLAWSADGALAVAGTSNGDLIALDQAGAVTWKKTIPAVDPPAVTNEPEPVVPGLPIFQGGRVPRGEHAYVGDIWMIKNGRDAVFVDSGGTSGIATTQARLRALGIDRVTNVLLTHTHGDHTGGAHLWRATGAQIVASKTAAMSLTWLMPMLTDYGLFPPCPLDLPLPVTRAGDETDFEAGGLKFRALYVPGHSFDLTIYKLEIDGRRIAFTGDLGFEAPSDILHRCWGDVDKARVAVAVIKEKLLPWKPDVVFTGHGVRREGTAFLTDLVRRTDESLAAAASVNAGQ